MGKKKRVDVAKQLALQAKKSAKADKAAKKRLLKQQRSADGHDDDDDDDDNDDNTDDSDDEDSDDVDDDKNRNIGNKNSKTTSTKTTTIENMDLILIEKYIQSQKDAQEKSNKNQSSVVIDLQSKFPLPRSNATLTVVTDTLSKKKKNIMTAYSFGGEYYDGIQNIVLNQLFMLELSSTTSGKDSSLVKWKQIITPISPPPRCAHTAVYYNRNIYIFGGEYVIASSDEYYHYKDLWKYNIDEQYWIEISGIPTIMTPSTTNSTTKQKEKGKGKSNTTTTNTSSIMSKVGTIPTSRSGHSSIVWKHYMIVFGGFYEVAKGDPKWFNDIYIMDLKTELWLDISHSKLLIRPEPRSRCNISYIDNNTDTIFIYGGFSKINKVQQQLQSQQSDNNNNNNSVDEIISETKVHTDAWLLHLKPLLINQQPTWERYTSSIPRHKWSYMAQTSPIGRCGTSCMIHSISTSSSKQNSTNQQYRIIFFGGVVDKELHHHQVDSIFYNDLYIFDTIKRKFYPLRLQTQKQETPNNNSNTNTSSKKLASSKISSTTKSKNDDDNSSSLLKKKKDDTSKVKDEYDDDDLDDESDDEDDDDNNDMMRLDEELDDNATIDQDNDDKKNMINEKGWDMTKLSTVLTFVDSKNNNETNINNNKQKSNTIDSNDDDDDDEEEEYKDNDSDDEVEEYKNGDHHNIGDNKQGKISTNKNRKMGYYDEPLPRIKASMFLHLNKLYIYGGILEMGDREVTLDDLWYIDLKKRQQWVCIYQGTMHQQVWKVEAEDDTTTASDNNSSTTGGINTNTTKNNQKDDSDNDNDDDEEKEEEKEKEQKKKIKNSKTRSKISDNYENDDEQETIVKVVNEQKEKRSEIRHTIKELVQQYQLDNIRISPQPDETIHDFYHRTIEYWNEQAFLLLSDDDVVIEDNTNQQQQYKDKGYQLCCQRYEELIPIMEQIVSYKIQLKQLKGGDDDVSKTKKNKDKSLKKR